MEIWGKALFVAKNKKGELRQEKREEYFFNRHCGGNR